MYNCHLHPCFFTASLFLKATLIYTLLLSLDSPEAPPAPAPNSPVLLRAGFSFSVDKLRFSIS